MKVNWYKMLPLVIALSVTCTHPPTALGKTGVQRLQSTQNRVDFVGKVVLVDMEGRSMTLRSGGNTVTFVISNPVLQGYDSIARIRKGDRVGARYTADGIHITKLPRTVERAVQEKAAPSRPPTTKRNTQFAHRVRMDGRSFASVDNNKDGMISPIELCVVIPNLTMEQFRTYDKNHDGHLDRAEFDQIKLPGR